ncbi:MAG TPA: hypothetical protein VEZ50_16720, partial [Nodosilinea sp.]|nr:hypothetical protein [Nodosilinea sp.]
MTPAAELVQVQRPRSQSPLLYVLLALVAALVLGVSGFGWQQSALALVGTLFGLTLYQASFGFASSYRHLLVRG